ncbi:hypothetical protein B0T24DRAFT_299400 [Lasiosphaeria ovina]|uniref:Uncharacterized protein n=1 Tax=Lasiosphaeria ovina TaxID=92902 RepID=A0AAE0K615_9PEZI|nr:hypothetical protein B0T24DRAFT_299400 [Lasiosphaeria ovina]
MEWAGRWSQMAQVRLLVGRACVESRRPEICLGPVGAGCFLLCCHRPPVPQQTTVIGLFAAGRLLLRFAAISGGVEQVTSNGSCLARLLVRFKLWQSTAWAYHLSSSQCLNLTNLRGEIGASRLVTSTLSKCGYYAYAVQYILYSAAGPVVSASSEDSPWPPTAHCKHSKSRERA